MMASPYSTFVPPMAMGPGKDNSAFSRRRRVNLLAVVLNAVVPAVVFITLFAVLTSSLRLQKPGLCWGTVAALFSMAGGLCYLAHRAKEQQQDPTWYSFAAGSLSLAVVLGFLFGELNYAVNMGPYYLQSNMNSYPSVNPAKVKGQQVLDAGRVYFIEDSALDLRKAMAYKDGDTYCVAPVIHGEDTPASYDYWAVGVNCCSAGAADFRCGAYNNPKARAGVRAMNAAEEPFLKLAVQQAEAAYNIKSQSPLFFHWVEDPLAKVVTLRDAGVKWFIMGCFMYIAFNLFLVAFAVVNFAKMSSL